MDHTRLAQLNDKHARTCAVLGNRKMAQAHRELAAYHRSMIVQKPALRVLSSST